MAPEAMCFETRRPSSRDLADTETILEKSLSETVNPTENTKRFLAGSRTESLLKEAWSSRDITAQARVSSEAGTRGSTLA